MRVEVYGYAKEDIVLMMDHKSIPRDLWPTLKNIVSSWYSYKADVDLTLDVQKRKQIQLFVQGVSSGDRLFFYCQRSAF